MRMDVNKNRKIIVVWGYAAAIVLNLFWIFQRNTLSIGQQLSIVLFTVILSGVSAFFHVATYRDVEKRRQVMYMSFFFLFLYYIFILVAVLFLDGFFLFGRTGAGAVNLIPFHSIRSYWSSYIHSQSNIAILNLFGNLALFSPMGFFLPLLFAKMRKWYYFLPTMLFATVGVEVMQFLLQVGSTDIDDVILNMIGVLLIFASVQLGRLPGKKTATKKS